MTDNKQNPEIQNKSTQNTPADSKPNLGGGAASTQRASDKPENNKSAANGESVTETVGKAATEVAGQAKDKAVSLIGEQKANLATGITSVADSIRQIGENLRNDGGNNQIASLAGKYGDTVAGQVEKFSQYVEESDLKEVARDVEQFARRNPALFVGGAFALGVLAARFLKSSNSAKSRGGSSTRKNPTAVQAS
jgi:hypothetical protein